MTAHRKAVACKLKVQTLFLFLCLKTGSGRSQNFEGQNLLNWPETFCQSTYHIQSGNQKKNYYVFPIRHILRNNVGIYCFFLSGPSTYIYVQLTISAWVLTLPLANNHPVTFCVPLGTEKLKKSSQAEKTQKPQ